MKCFLIICATKALKYIPLNQGILGTLKPNCQAIVFKRLHPLSSLQVQLPPGHIWSLSSHSENPSLPQISTNLTKPIVPLPSLPVLQHTALSNSSYKPKTFLYVDEYQLICLCVWTVERRVVYTHSNMLGVLYYTNTLQYYNNHVIRQNMRKLRLR